MHVVMTQKELDDLKRTYDEDLRRDDACMRLKDGEFKFYAAYNNYDMLLDIKVAG
jgi:hypothetical protein